MDWGCLCLFPLFGPLGLLCIVYTSMKIFCPLPIKKKEHINQIIGNKDVSSS